ncbi:SOS response-associated peptidase family protein [Chitinolyticbacter meiyuanensis]|uniref:SOS response-associated peptidase family protein n=1 Tax=Chitinolyticbacter meiyuanensis TaxID=682798 RepID=UPI001C9E6CD8|nr:SOS response-associated peptidase family protein [Chitinolyticbacter meiyuanensis]
MQRFAQFSSHDLYRVAAGWLRDHRADRRVANYNVSPGMDVLVMHQLQGYNMREVARATWGYRPGWASRKGLPAVPTASSTQGPKEPYFKRLWEMRRRCVVPMDGWFEWAEIDGERRTFFVQRKGGRPVFAAGLCNVDPADPWRDTGVVILTHPTLPGLVDPTEPRPLLLSREAIQRWIAQEGTATDALYHLMHEPPSDLEFIRLRASLSNLQANSDALLEPA